MNEEGEISSLIVCLNTFKMNKSPLLSCIQDFSLLIEALQELNSMIEMHEVKKSIVLQIKFLLVNSSQNNKTPHSDIFEGHMLHTVLSGPPGAGKSHVGTILAKIWTALGFLKNNNKPKEEIPIKEKENLKGIDIYIKNLLASGIFKNSVIKKLQEHLLFYRQQLEEEIKLSQLDLYKIKTTKSEIEKLLVNDYRLMKIFNSVSDTILDTEKRKLRYKNLIENVIQEENIPFQVIVKKNNDEDGDDESGNENNENENNDNNNNNNNNDNKNSINVELPNEKSKDTEKEGNPYAELDDLIKNMVFTSVAPPQPPPPPPPTLKILGETDLDPKKFDLIRIVSREDFIGGYMGQSALKTEKLLRDSMGKVLFIDEAYSLVNDEKDSYGIEALSTLNRFMSEHAKEIIIIFAGYKDKLESTIFKFQPGLKRRCTWNFEIAPYTEIGLAHIFKEQMKKANWYVDEEIDLINFFKENKEDFPFFGGDTLRFSFYCKICYSSEVFNFGLANNRVINKKILYKSLEDFRASKLKEDKENMSYKMLYV